MNYIVRENGSKFEVVERGYEDIVLSKHATQKEAEYSKRQWIYRDELQDKITDFLDEQLDNYGTILDEKEIREMIREGV